MLASEMVAQVSDKNPLLICIAAMAPTGLAHARYLCKRIRAHFPDAKILVVRWGPEENLARIETSLTSAGADRISSTLRETRDQLLPLLPLTPSRQASAPVRRTAT
jgi:hypothetical protein